MLNSFTDEEIKVRESFKNVLKVTQGYNQTQIEP